MCYPGDQKKHIRPITIHNSDLRRPSTVDSRRSDTFRRSSTSNSNQRHIEVRVQLTDLPVAVGLFVVDVMLHVARVRVTDAKKTSFKVEFLKSESERGLLSCFLAILYIQDT